MLRLLMIGIVLLSVCAVASSAQDRERLNCSSPRVNAPSEILRPGETARFTVTFDSNKPASNFLKYNWQLSSGRIISGQGTETIEVEPKIHYVRATVRLTGFRGDNDCAHPVEATVHWDVRPGAEKVRAFTRFDGRTVVPLPNDHFLVIFLGLQKNTSEETARERETQILEKLEENVDRNQTTIVRVYGGVDITEYWSVPRGAENPTCEGCELPAKVEKQECPIFTMFGPTKVMLPGEIGKWTADLRAIEKRDRLEFMWSAFYRTSESSAPTIVPIHHGQGTPAIEIVQPKFQLSVVLEIKGLPAGCPSFASATAPISHIFSNNGANTDCPTISVKGPAGITYAGETEKFKVELEPKQLQNLRFEWTVSRGTIGAGQGTSEIMIPTDSQVAEGKIIARVTVFGLPPNCVVTAEDYANVAHKTHDYLSDHFGKIPLRDQMGRLDNLVIQLRKNPGETGQIILRYKTSTSKTALAKRVKAIRNHVFQYQRIPKNRIVIISEPSDVEDTRIWMSTPENALPICSNCKIH